MDDAGRREELTCRALVELLTDYLEGALDESTDTAVTRHLLTCPPCRAYVTQIRATITATGEVSCASLDIRTQRDLVRAFRALLG